MGIISNNIPAIAANSNVASQQENTARKSAHNSKGQQLNSGSDIAGKSIAKDAKAAETMAKLGKQMPQDVYEQRIKDADKADNKYATIYNKKGRVAEKEDERRRAYEYMDDPYVAIARMSFLIIGEQLIFVNENGDIDDHEIWGSIAVANLIIGEMNHLSDGKVLDVLDVIEAFEKGYELAVYGQEKPYPKTVEKTKNYVIEGLKQL